MKGRPRVYAPKIQVALHPPVLKALRSLAKLRGCTTSELIREACRRYVLDQIEEIKNAQSVPTEMAAAVHTGLHTDTRSDDSNTGG